MTPADTITIADFLFERGSWYSEAFLEDHFDVSERELRRRLAGVGITGPQGWIHSAHATIAELEAYFHPKDKHWRTERDNLRSVLRNRKKGIQRLERIAEAARLAEARVEPIPATNSGQLFLI